VGFLSGPQFSQMPALASNAAHSRCPCNVTRSDLGLPEVRQDTMQRFGGLVALACS
jgi:hypothetical protein